MREGMGPIYYCLIRNVRKARVGNRFRLDDVEAVSRLIYKDMMDNQGPWPIDTGCVCDLCTFEKKFTKACWDMVDRMPSVPTAEELDWDRLQISLENGNRFIHGGA